MMIAIPGIEVFNLQAWIFIGRCHMESCDAPLGLAGNFS